MTHNRIRISGISMILALGLLTAPGLFAQAENFKALLGSWDVELIDMGLQMEFIFKMDGDEITGEMVFDMGGAKMEDIAFEEGVLTFNASVDAGGQFIEISASAKVEDETMEGSMMSDMGEASFSGTKRKD